MIIYFSKVNLESTELFDVYKGAEVLNDVRISILSYLKNNAVYKVNSSYLDGEGQSHDVSTEYRIAIRKKEDNCIYGVIYKETYLLYKRMNQVTGEIEPKSVPTIEDIQFYYDLTKEIVGFHTRNRFGHREFNTAFAEILNKCMQDNKKSYCFSLGLYNEGMEIEEIEKELKNIGSIKKLTFNFRAPNPADDKMLDDLEEGLDRTVDQMKKANANGMSVIFDSNGKVGLNVESEEIKKNIGRIGGIHSKISAKDAIKNGYASVKAISKSGKIYTTEEQKPVKREIINEMEFLDACKDTIISIFSTIGK